MNPAIVIVTHSRISSLNRLLNSINNANYKCSNIPLIISIDGGAKTNNEIYEMATDFNWKYGEKIIIRHQINLGLREHILSCGDLSTEYGAVIVFEDDLFVSPYFYEYTIQAIDFYQKDDHIAQISLYSYNVNVHAGLQFIPLKSEYDTYFMQFPASWGQCWTRTQWSQFRIWYNKGQEILESDRLPQNVKNWPETSWLKYFNKYVVTNNKYVVYPYWGLSTNFSEIGVHNDYAQNIYQCILPYTMSIINFAEFKNCEIKYDSYFEIIPESLINHSEFLKNYEFEVDFYGIKLRDGLNSKYFLSSNKCKKPLISFPLTLKPHELNVILPIFDNLCQLNLGTRNSFLPKSTLLSNFENKYSTNSIRNKLNITIKKIKNKLNL